MKQQNSPLIQFAFIVLALMVIIGGGMFFFRRYGDNQLVVSQLENENSVLDNRIQVLSNSSEELSQYVDTAYRSIPESNAGLFAINTIKNIQSTEEVLVDGVYVKTAPVEKGQQQRSEIGFEVEGNTGQIFNFLLSISESLPIVKLLELETRVTEGDFATAIVSMEGYSQALPEELPSLKEALPTISEEERELLSRLSNYEFPPLVADQPSSDSDVNFGRENPFSAVTTQTSEVQ